MAEYFHESHWGQCLELLSHLCHYSDNILLATGPSGIGKTAMKQALMEQEADQFVFCEVNGTPNITAEQLTVIIENDFEVVNNNDLLLLIDDAQFLGLDVISMLFQLKQKTSELGRLHIILFATAEFEQKIARSVLKDDFAEQVQTIKIEALSITEMEAFLRQQWRATQHNNDMPFDRARIKKMYAISGGIPGKVLEVMEQQIAGVKTAKTQEPHSLSPFTVGLTVSFGVLFCILAILWPAADKNIITRTETSLVESMQIAQTGNNPEPAATTASESSQSKIAEVAQIETTVVPEVATTLEQDTVITTAVTASVSPDPVVQMQLANTIESNDEKIANLEKKVSELQRQLASEQKALRITEQKLQQLLAKNHTVNIKDVSVRKSTKTLGFTKQEKEILALPSRNYTLQLLCMTDEVKVKNFIKDNNLQYKANYYKSNMKGKDWYVLIYGNYATKNDALLAMAKLPNALRKLNPKARDYRNIQQAISTRTQS